MTPTPPPPTSEIWSGETLLTTKLYIPRLRSTLVPRPHLIVRLNQALEQGVRLILLSTPPGAGKTTLLSQWVNAGLETERAVAWLSLDEDDNDPRRFLTYSLAALKTVQPQVAEEALEQLRQRWPHFSSPRSLMTVLINQMAGITSEFLFVLDDYHLLERRLIHEGLAFLLEHLPPYGTLVIASRTEPDLPLARLRGRGELLELHAADLRFTLQETATFLNQVMNLDLSEAQIAALEARTEGWIAGLQMAALSMQGRRKADATALVKALAGSHRHILDYLMEELLQQQSAVVQSFLLQSSILDRLCASLCNAVASPAETSLSEAEAQQMLEHLEQANLFLIPLDDERRWYRYHQLFADLLRHHLAQTRSPEQVAALHRRASGWFESQGLPTEAMRHALAAVDIERVVRLARQKAAAMLSRSELVALVSWLDALPEVLTRSRPGVSLLHAWAMVLTGQLEAVEAHLQTAEQALQTESNPPHTQGEITTLRATVAYFKRDMDRAIELYEQALAQLPPDNLFLRGAVSQSLGAAYSWRGQTFEAARAFTEVIALSQATANSQIRLIALTSLAQIRLDQGALQQAAGVYAQGQDLVQQAQESGAEELPLSGRVYVGLAALAYERNELETATQYLLTGLKLAEAQDETSTLTHGYLLLSRLHQAQGRFTEAVEALQKATSLARRYNGPFYWDSQVEVQQARLDLAQGNLRAVAAWLQKRELPYQPLPPTLPYPYEDAYLILARLLLTWVDDEIALEELPLPVETPISLALDIVSGLIQAARQTGRTARVMEALALQALLLYLRDESPAEVLRPLRKLLKLAGPENYIRLFVDEGPLMEKLLRQAAAQRVAQPYVTRLLAAFETEPAAEPEPATGPDPASEAILLDPLSERELEFLPLIAAGMSNRQLAEELVVTVGTVKWHLNNIYSKLGVRNRTQAVARARELGLI